MISICIPTYEMYGKGVQYLNELLDSIEMQTYKDYEIIVSDHSLNEDIKNACLKRENVRYLHNNRKYGSSSANLNNAIDKAQGDIIKPMFQDDKFYFKQTLLEISDCFNHIKQKWIVCESDNKNIRFTPKYNFNCYELSEGENTFGCPSAVAWKNCDLRFNEDLQWLMDCEFYTRLILKYGQPTILYNQLIYIRNWSGQVTHTITGGTVLVEREICNNLYKHLKK